MERVSVRLLTFRIIHWLIRTYKFSMGAGPVKGHSIFLDTEGPLRQRSLDTSRKGVHFLCLSKKGRAYNLRHYVPPVKLNLKYLWVTNLILAVHRFSVMGWISSPETFVYNQTSLVLSKLFLLVVMSFLLSNQLYVVK